MAVVVLNFLLDVANGLSEVRFGGMRRLGFGGEGDCRARENDESVLTVPGGPYSPIVW